MTAITRTAYAKLNLYLHITGKRDDGYHLLDSLVAFADVGDEIRAVPADDLTLRITGPFAGALDGEDLNDNLVMQAARSLAEHAGVEPHARLTLVKNLPVASGIGGGSADAAATIKALVELWGIELPDHHIHHAASQLTSHEETHSALSTLFKLWRDDLDADMLHTVASALGADVPVCLEGRTLFMGGIGEQLDLAPTLPPVWVVLVNPGVALSTPEVFGAREGDFDRPDRFRNTPGDAGHLAQLLATRHNGLSDAAIKLTPEIGDVLAALEQTDGALLTRMSGSGATCFALFASADGAEIARKRLAQAHPDWWCAAAQLIEAPLEY
ncbi:4-(cytidine 5'-diphospho)-2-C-methyl-D-erythritol kinase [Pseudomonadota bacterium]